MYRTKVKEFFQNKNYVVILLTGLVLIFGFFYYKNYNEKKELEKKILRFRNLSEYYVKYRYLKIFGNEGVKKSVENIEKLYQKDKEKMIKQLKAYDTLQMLRKVKDESRRLDERIERLEDKINNQ